MAIPAVLMKLAPLTVTVVMATYPEEDCTP